MQMNKKTDIFEEIFEFHGKFYKIKKDQYEPRELYLERVWYILNNNDPKISFEELIKKSRIFINSKYLKCSYLSS